ncbi:MAG: hypothetical protein KKC26_07815 [Nanoarchaeota archaeon]|nr:hypothetical protein [Nanoarchaeota archaeon]
MEELISNITKDIISKKELKNLDEQFVKTKLLLFLKKKPILKRKLEENNCNKKSKEYKFVIKEMRKSLREIYGVFITKDYSKKDFILNELKNAKVKTEREQIINKLLSLHQSSKERIPIYSEVYKQIFEITGKPNKILDLGCGLNPLSYHYLGCKPYYIASDMNIKDTDFLKRFFDQEEIT